MTVLADYKTRSTEKTDARAKSKLIVQAERDFKKLIRKLEDQFDTSKTALLE